MKPNHPLAVITGASCGIGRSFAERLAQMGYDLLLTARDRSALNLVASAIRAASGVRVEVVAGDLCDPVHRLQLAGMLRDRGRTEVLVNNAGFGNDKPFHAMTSSEVQTMIDTHDVAPAVLIQAVLPGMISRGRSTIINVSSLSAFLPGMCRTTYLATKMFLHQLSLGLCLELEPFGIRVQSLCPGFVRTRFKPAKMSASLQRKLDLIAFMDAGDVVESSVRAAQTGQAVCIPGAGYRFCYFLARILPLSVFRFLARMMRKGKANPSPAFRPAAVHLPAA